LKIAIRFRLPERGDVNPPTRLKPISRIGAC
jgi:hypothetical protein